jgi:citrate lyase beta subunit
MKYFLVALLLATSALADSPEAIIKDYRKQAAQAVERLNQSLEKAATPLITKLVSSGDTAGAELLTAQLKSKLGGDLVPKPQASAVSLFTMYDEARAKVLAPVQKSSIARIEGMLKTAGGAKLETVAELGKVREEIEAGKLGSNSLPTEWSYRRTPTDREEATIWLNPGGKFMIDDGTVKKTGTWKRSAEKGTLTIQVDNEKWTVEIKDGVGTIQRSVGTRFMVAK